MRSRATTLVFATDANGKTECSAKKNRGVNEAFTEAARVALQVKNVKGDKEAGCCTVM